jgi:hypothetical protein
MFSSVANYLFGSSQPEEESVKDMELETTSAKDDDWLLVNIPGTYLQSLKMVLVHSTA